MESRFKTTRTLVCPVQLNSILRRPFQNVGWLSILTQVWILLAHLPSLETGEEQIFSRLSFGRGLQQFARVPSRKLLCVYEMWIYSELWNKVCPVSSTHCFSSTPAGLFEHWLWTLTDSELTFEHFWSRNFKFSSRSFTFSILSSFYVCTPSDAYDNWLTIFWFFNQLSTQEIFAILR